MFPLKAIYAVCLAAVTLGGCVSIPYQTPESQQRIRQDLGISDITDISETNWCRFDYGPVGLPCTATQGLGVLTPSGLILSRYKGGAYQHEKTLTVEEVDCSYSDTTESLPILFTESYIWLVVPVTPRGQLNQASLDTFMNHLHSNGQKRLVGPETPHLSPSGEKTRLGRDIMSNSNPCRS